MERTDNDHAADDSPTPRPSAYAPGAPGETDDVFRAMLAGIRTTLPGSQLLLGFLMTVPLQAQFENLAGTTRTAYLVALIASASSSVLLIAPSAQARVRYPVSGIRRQTPQHVQFAGYLALAGTLTLLVALTASMLFALSYVMSTVVAVVISAVVGGTAVVTWVVVPLTWTLRDD